MSSTELADLLDRVFTEQVPLPASSDTSGRRSPSQEALWTTLEQLGITQLVAPEALGGSGGDIHDAAAALVAIGRHAVPLPLAETMFLAGSALVAAGTPVPSGRLVLVGLDDGHQLRVSTDDVTGNARSDHGTLTGIAPRVPWGSHADALVVLAETDGGTTVVGLARGAEVSRRGDTIAGEPCDDFVFVSQELTNCAPAPNGLREQLRRRHALMRSLQTVGALERIQALTLQHANDRVQFGRPIARFQAVAQHIALLAADVAVARAAVDLAVDVAAETGTLPLFEVASARVVCASAAHSVSAAAHQVHGAIGVTAEHPLHRFTRRAWAWQDDGEPEEVWAAELGRAVRTAPDGGWSLISATEPRTA